MPRLFDEIICLPRRPGDPQVPAVVVGVNPHGVVHAVTRGDRDVVLIDGEYALPSVSSGRGASPAPPYYPSVHGWGRAKRQAEQ